MIRTSYGNVPNSTLETAPKRFQQILFDAGLGEYIPLFEQHRITSPEMIRSLKKKDFREIGIHAIGDRQRITALFEEPQTQQVQQSYAVQQRQEQQTVQSASQTNLGVEEDGEERSINVGETSIDVIFVAAGTFTQGGSNFGNPISRRVTLTKGFWIGKYPVTQAQYRAVMGNNPSRFGGRLNNPVESVTWFEATEFSSRVGGRLPTEAEWEFAARGGNRSQGFIYSGSNDLDEVGRFWSNSSRSTQAVGRKLPNELGIYDMSGNVWEWVGDWGGNFNATAVTDPTGPGTGSLCVYRGGSWFSGTEICRVANRSNFFPDISLNSLGFRVVFSKIKHIAEGAAFF